MPAPSPDPVDKALEFIGAPHPEHPGHLIKRVIGMPGDKVVCCDGRGPDHASTATRWTRPATSTPIPTATQVAPSDVKFEVVVPKDRIFVMGDHRDLSADSRCHLSDLSTSQGRGAGRLRPESSWSSGPAFAIAGARSTARNGCVVPPPSTTCRAHRARARTQV